MTLKSLNAFEGSALPADWLDRWTPSLRDNAISIDPLEGAQFIRVLSVSRLINRQTELLAWLKGEVQQFLPHQIVVGAWGDFARWKVNCEMISNLLAVRALPIAGGPLDQLLRQSYARWQHGGREPLLLECDGALHGALHGALQGMRSLIVHGVRDKRSGCDSLYVALDTRRLVQRRPPGDFVALAHLLFCQIDIVWRRVAASRLEDLRAAHDIDELHGFELSAREREILGRLARGSTNHDIAEQLEISLFTVKNHLKRIFRKTGASNRTQAAALYNDALTQSAKGAAG
jgi:transcriptional regulator EpsA